MPRGYPDFYGYSIVPKYGSAQEETDSSWLASVAGYTTILKATGKGRSYSGYVLAYGAGTIIEDFKVEFEIDGVTFTPRAANSVLIWNYHADWKNLLNLSCAEVYDTGERVCFIVAPDWTWIEYCEIRVENTSGANAQVVSELQWGKVV